MPRCQETERFPSISVHEWTVPPAQHPNSKSTHSNAETEASSPLKATTLSQGEPTYPTGFGEVTFEELYSATSRIVGFVLRERMGMADPYDIDDCLQSGYLKVWQRLRQHPNTFAEKPKKYIVQAVVFYSKAQRYAHSRHYRKIAYEGDVQEQQDTTSLTIPQVDIWIDLSWALQRVAQHTAALANSIYLFALYALITTVKTRDVAVTNRYGVSTLTAAKRRIRSTLAKELPEYGKLVKPVEPLALVKTRQPWGSSNEQQHISQLLLEDNDC